MFKPKLKLLATPEKNRPEKPFVQLEGKLTPSAIGGDRRWSAFLPH